MARNSPPAQKYATYSQLLAYKFIALLSDGPDSIPKILRENPDLPTYKTLRAWRDRKPYFAKAWEKAKLGRAHRIFEHMLELQESATPKNAHQVRVKFDILKFYISRVCPELYGDKPAGNSISVQTNVVIGPEQLNAIRGNLDRARSQFTQLVKNKRRLEERHSLKSHYPPDLLEFDKRRAEAKASNHGYNPEVPKKDAFTLQLPSPVSNNETQSQTG